MTTTYEVYLRDENGERISQLDTYTSLSFVRRFNSVGTWTLVSTPTALAGITEKGGIEVFRNAKSHFSGIVKKFQDDDGLVMTIAGKNDLMVVEKGLAYPVPAGAPFTTDYDMRTGVAETVIKQFVDYNVGPHASAARRAAGLTIETDFGRGSVVTGRARFDKLLDLIKSLANKGGIGFRVSNLSFEVFTPEDKTGTIVFSKEMGTLGDYTLTIEAGDANYIVCGGSGEGSARTFVEGSDSESILNWGRSEAFLDQGTTSSTTEMNASITEELSKQAEKISLTFTPIVTENMRPIDDYDIGDWVKVIINGQIISQQVREIKTTLDGKGGETLTMAIGTDGASSDLSSFSRIYSRVREIDQRLNVQERR